MVWGRLAKPTRTAGVVGVTVAMTFDRGAVLRYLGGIG